MEQNRVLMIVVAIVIFVAAIVGVGMALLYPEVTSSRTESADIGARQINPTEYLRPPRTEPLIPEDLQALPEVAFGLNDDDSVTEPGDDPELDPDPDSASDATVDPTPATHEPAPTTRSDGTVAPRVVAAPVTRAPTIAAPAPTTTAPRRPRRSTSTAPAPAPTRSSAPVHVTEYWIQLIASPSRDRIDQANVRLSDVNLSGRVTTRQVEDTLYYRLRVGPYRTQEEAEKFLEWIGKLDGFEDAYISEEYPRRS